jgi:hypothetical protein
MAFSAHFRHRKWGSKPSAPPYSDCLSSASVYLAWSDHRPAAPVGAGGGAVPTPFGKLWIARTNGWLT